MIQEVSIGNYIHTIHYSYHYITQCIHEQNAQLNITIKAQLNISIKAQLNITNASSPQCGSHDYTYTPSILTFNPQKTVVIALPAVTWSDHLMLKSPLAFLASDYDNKNFNFATIIIMLS